MAAGRSMTIRVLIADDHAVVRQGLRMFLALDAELEVVGEAEDGTQALSRAVELRPDVVLMDMLMPVMDGMAATEAIRGELPDTEVIALTSVLDDSSVVGAVKAGAIGYLLKDTNAEELCRAIKAAAAGQVQLAPQAAARLVRQVRTPDVAPTALSERETRGPPADRPREGEQGDRGRADDRREDCEDARQQHPQQARGAEPDAGRPLRRSVRPRPARIGLSNDRVANGHSQAPRSR